MKELSLNILDVTKNSVTAGADRIDIFLTLADDGWLEFKLTDNGCGMSEEVCKMVTDPFYTTRTTRKVGMGLPLLKLAAEQTGGYVKIESRHYTLYPDSHGTKTSALFYKRHLDYTPLGDIVSTLTTLVQGHPEVDFLFEHSSNERCVKLDTKELREILGDVPLDSFEVILWIKEYLEEQYSS